MIPIEKSIGVMITPMQKSNNVEKLVQVQVANAITILESCIWNTTKTPKDIENVATVFELLCDI